MEVCTSTTKIYGVHDSKKEARVSFFVLELQKALLVPRTCFFLPCTFQLVCAILIWKCASFMVCTLRQNRVRMPRGVHIKKTGCAPFEGCTGLSEGAQVSVRGAHLSNITYDLRFLFLRAFLHIMCIRCYFTKFYYFLPFLAMSRGSHGVILPFWCFASAKGVFFWLFGAQPQTNPK